MDRRRNVITKTSLFFLRATIRKSRRLVLMWPSVCRIQGVMRKGSTPVRQPVLETEPPDLHLRARYCQAHGAPYGADCRYPVGFFLPEFRAHPWAW